MIPHSYGVMVPTQLIVACPTAQPHLCPLLLFLLAVKVNYEQEAAASKADTGFCPKKHA